MKRIITRTLVIIFSIGMLVSLVMNFFLQVYLDEKQFQKKAENHFTQIERLLEETAFTEEPTELSRIFSMLSVDSMEKFFVVDRQSGSILDATDREKIHREMTVLGVLKKEKIGEKLSYGKVKLADGLLYSYAAKQMDALILLKLEPSFALHRDIWQNTLLLCLYFLMLFFVLMASSYIFIEKRILRPIVSINKKLRKIGQGNWDIVLSENSVKEFEELSNYINAMVDSLIDFPKKISKALERSEVPIAICEYVPSSNHFTATSRIGEILQLDDSEFGKFEENPKLFEQKLKELMTREKCLKENIYCMGGEKKSYIRIETFAYQNSRMTTLIDVTSEILEQQKLVRERDTDLLTGLYNRRAFYREIETLFQQDTERLKTAVMVMIDLDKLKMVNDVYGHEAGDRYLKTFAEFMKCLEAPNKLAARMGGDEFILFMYGMEEDDVEPLLRELATYRGICPVYMDNGENVILEFSMGWAEYPQESLDYQELLAKADERMYEEKNLRKSQKEELKREYKQAKKS